MRPRRNGIPWTSAAFSDLLSVSVSLILILSALKVYPVQKCILNQGLKSGSHSARQLKEFQFNQMKYKKYKTLKLSRRAKDIQWKYWKWPEAQLLGYLSSSSAILVVIGWILMRYVMKYTNTLGAEYRSQKDTLLPKYISLDDVSSWSTCLKLKYKWKMQKQPWGLLM